MVYYQPKSIADILARGGEKQTEYLSQVTGAAGGLPALGALAQTGLKVAQEREERMTLQMAREVYSNFLSMPVEKQNEPEIAKYGMMAALALGLTPPDRGAAELRQSSIEENRASAGLKRATSDLYKRAPGTTPSADGTGPEIITKDDRQFLVKRGLKGQVSYAPLQPTGAEKPIPAETAKTQNLARAGLGAIAQIRAIVNDPANKERFLDPSFVAGGVGGQFLAAMTGDTQSQILGQQIGEAGDALARLRTGAAITDTEEARYGNLLKGRFKTSAAYANALKTVETFLTNVERDLQTGRRRMTAGGPSALGAPTTPPAAPGGTSDVLDRYGAP